MLGIILGRLELAIEQLPADQPIVRDLLQAQQAARHSATLTRDLLAFARQEAVAPQVTDLNEITAGMADMLRSMLGEQIALEIRPATEPWPVRVDLTQMSQVLMNLCINGRDAIKGVGAITIETSNVILTEADCAGTPGHTPGEHAALTVRDTGCGIAPEALARMFEPFFTTKGVGEGTGLGLAQVYGAATQSGGIVRAESVEGKGTTVHVFLPRAVGEATPVAAPEPSERPLGRGETVLLVEDEKGLLTTCRRFLTPLGYDVMSASSPAEALALSEAYGGSIDLLLTDVVMPEMDGAELADRLVAARPGLRRLFMSGYTAEALGSRLLRDNATLLPKPFTRDELARAVRTALDATVPSG
jgi:CheY-like chemotaxis protein